MGSRAEEEAALEACLDAGGGHGDLSGDEGLAAARGLVIEEDAVDREDAVGLAVVAGDVEGVSLGRGVGAPRVERGSLGLRRLNRLAVELGGGGLVEAGIEVELAHGFEQANGADAGDLGGVLRDLEGDLDVGLGAEVVDLVGAHGLEDAVQ